MSSINRLAASLSALPMFVQMRIWDPESKTCLSVIKLKGLGTSLNPCMPCSNFPM